MFLRLASSDVGLSHVSDLRVIIFRHVLRKSFKFGSLQVPELAGIWAALCILDVDPKSGDS